MSMDTLTEEVTIPAPETPKQKRAYNKLMKAAGKNEPEAFELYPEVPRDKLRAMDLKRHYRPRGQFEIVGYHQPEIKRKNPAGQEIVIQKAEFIPDKMAPSPMPGVDVAGKIWASTVIRVPAEEAKAMRDAGIAERSLEDDA